MRALELAVCLSIALDAGLSHAQPEVVVLLEATDVAQRMHESLAGGASEALRSLRAEVGDQGAQRSGGRPTPAAVRRCRDAATQRSDQCDRARVVRRASLGRRLAECDVAEPACADAIARALGGARVIRVRVEHTRGGHVPILRDGRRVGHRTLRATQVIAGWLGEASERREHLATGATETELLDRLRAVVRDQLAR